MEEAWERAVEAARGKEDAATIKSLTLDGAVKSFQCRLPPPSLLQPFVQLQKLSLANIGLTSLVEFPCLPQLKVLNLSDNRIATGLEHLVEAGLCSLEELGLSNNRIQLLEDLKPLSELRRLVSLDLYKCPVTSTVYYRPKVFSMIKGLQFLDNMDADDSEKPESDEDGDDDNDEEEGGGSYEESAGGGEENGVKHAIEEAHSDEDGNDEEEDVAEQDGDESEDEEGDDDNGEGIEDEDNSGGIVSAEPGSDDSDDDEEKGEPGDEEEISDKEDGDGYEEDYGTEYLIREPGGHPEDDEGASDFEPGEDEEDEEIEDDDEGDDDEDGHSKAASAVKRKWSEDDNSEKGKRLQKH
ncbi:hypothetical protein O6H91_Y061100 [Diphasiastrum complanatum]|nr:hypothetical protein O6H91_Y061100 [Diphasiastrum complanatum]